MIKPLDRTGTWKTYSMANGLTGVRVEHIAEDSEGYLWFATWDNGVSRFDGDEFQNFTQQDGLVHSRVYAISKDSQNQLWFGTLNGVCWYDGANFHHLEDDGIAGRTVQFIYEDSEGRIWCGGQRTLGYYDGTAFHDIMPLIPDWNIPNCWGITEDPQGHLWFGSEYPIRFDGTSFHRYEEEEGFSQTENSYTVSQDHSGKVWIGRLGYGDRLWCYDGTFESVQVDLSGWLRRIQCDGTGRMWFCTSEGVLYQDGDRFSRFTPADGLPHPAVKAVFQDREHQLWFATWGGVGLYDERISVFDLDVALHDRSEISQIVQDRRGDIWAGCASPRLSSLHKSVFRFDGEYFAFVGTDNGDINNCFAMYEDHDGDLFFGGRYGLFRYDGKKLKKTKMVESLDEKSISAIIQDSQGQFLFGHWENKNNKRTRALLASPQKLIYQQGEQFKTIFVEDKNKDHYSRIGTVIVGRDSEVYFYLYEKNLSDTDKGFARWHPKDGLKFYGIEDGLIDHNVNDLLLDRDGYLWVATQKGLCRFDGSVFHTFTTEDGLPSNRIRCLLEDRRGHLWLGIDEGVVHYDGHLFQTIKSPHIGPVCQILEDRDGNFYFGTILGSIIRYRRRQTPPQVRLLRVIADKVYEDFEEAIASTAGHQMIFEYKGMSFSTHPRDMLYIYRLKGHDSDWQPATREMRVHYRALPPGDYTFQVRAIDRDLNYSEVAQVQLIVEPDPRISALTSELNSTAGIGRKFIGQSEALQQFQIRLMKVASTDLTVLIMGETGVGKGLAARVLHALSSNGDGPFVQVNCGALPETLIDSELFGHEKGAFTSAVSRRIGKVELAKGGTLFLDEVGDMAVGTQARMLRLLEDGIFERVGGSETLRMKARIVAATNRDLREMVSAGTFREDLFYRFQVFPLYLPPLRDRKEDIPDLAEYFKHRLATHIGKQIDPLTPEVIEVLQACDWPGNVRELEHTIQRAVVVCRGSQIEVMDIGLLNNSDSVSPDREVVPYENFERRYILDVLKATRWRITGENGAATLLKLPPSTLYNKMKKLGIKRP